ncbi:Stf0 family sulfotransferase [Sinorhizobium meliloti]|uniref:Stf0 family sulfotransferase n=1 Tax=Rhizobium meliloti TaxID=382 RepID=UPI003F18A2D0
MSKFDSYVICTSPRSGSTLLCKLLAATGVSGNPGSYFHRPSVSEWLAYFGLAPEASAPESDTLAMIFQEAIAKGRLDTGMFGLRLQRHSFDFFVQKRAVLHSEPAGDLKRFEAAFGRTLFIHLTRLDKVQQAVSHVKAEQTGLWHMAPDGTELERLAPPRVPVYNAEDIRACYDRLTTFDRDWNNWFDMQGIEPLRITYGALSSDPIETLREILGQLGLNRGAASGVVPGVAKLADETSQDWAARFRLERGIA